MARCLGCGGEEEEEGEDCGQELEDVQLDGGDAMPPAGRRSRSGSDPLRLLKGAVEPDASQQHSSV